MKKLRVVNARETWYPVRYSARCPASVAAQLATVCGVRLYPGSKSKILIDAWDAWYAYCGARELGFDLGTGPMKHYRTTLQDFIDRGVMEGLTPGEEQRKAAQD